MNIDTLVRDGFKLIGNGEEDGQGFFSYYSRKKGETWEYAIANVTDDGYVREVILLRQGKMKTVLGDY